MNKILILFPILFLLLSGPIVLAEAGDDSVTDFFNEEETDILDSMDDPAMPPEESNTDLLLTDHDSPSLLELIVRIVIVLALIIGLIYILLKLFNRSGTFNRQGDNLVNLGGLSLGANKSVQMIRVGEKVLLIGVGETISLLTEIEDETIKERLMEEEREPNVSKFDLFNSIRSKNETTFKNQDQQSKNDFTSMFKHELEALKEKRTSIRSKLKKEEER